MRIAAADASWEKKVQTGKMTGSEPDWSPDGGKLALTLFEKQSTALAVLENFLPKEKVAAAQEARATEEENRRPSIKTLISGELAYLSPDESKITAWRIGCTALSWLLTERRRPGSRMHPLRTATRFGPPTAGASYLPAIPKAAGI